MQEPIAQNRFGLAQIAGTTPATFINTEANTGGANSQMAEFATMSDDKDMLAFAQFGPIRVLQMNLSATTGNTGTGKFIMVQLGQPTTLGSVLLPYTLPGAWTATPNQPLGWGGQGDLMRLGIQGDSEGPSLGPLGSLYISRTGRYYVNVQWQFSLTTGITWAAGDRLEWRINWPGNLVEYGGCAIYSWVPSGGGLGSLGGNPVIIRGERSFYFNIAGTSPQQDIPIPGIECIKITSTGTVSTVSVSGGGAASVVRYGAVGVSSANNSSWNSFWTKAKRDASWARGLNDPPI